MAIYVRTGYWVRALIFDGRREVEGIVVRVGQRFGLQNRHKPIPINPLITVLTDSGEKEHFDSSFVMSCVHPSKVNKRYVCYPVQNDHMFERLTKDSFNPNRTKKRGVLCGTPMSLWYEALPGVVRDYGDMHFDTGRIYKLFAKSSVAHEVQRGFYEISKKNLKRLIKQNKNRMLEPLKYVHERATESNFDIEIEIEQMLHEDMLEEDIF